MRVLGSLRRSADVCQFCKPQNLWKKKRRFIFKSPCLNYFIYVFDAVCTWLRHYATSRKVAGSRPDEIN
jgi:hypothetical protein